MDANEYIAHTPKPEDSKDTGQFGLAIGLMLPFVLVGAMSLIAVLSGWSSDPLVYGFLTLFIVFLVLPLTFWGIGTIMVYLENRSSRPTPHRKHPTAGQ